MATPAFKQFPELDQRAKTLTERIERLRGYL